MKMCNFFKLLNLNNFSINFMWRRKKVDQRQMHGKKSKMLMKNIEDQKVGKVGGDTYEFSSSNPMWRASLETLDFLPLTTVDYSGGTIITDWYSENQFNRSYKNYNKISI